MEYAGTYGWYLCLCAGTDVKGDEGQSVGIAVGHWYGMGVHSGRTHRLKVSLGVVG